MGSPATTARILTDRPPAAVPVVLTVEDVMTRSVIALRTTERLRAATEILLLHGVGGAPVELGGVVLGMVTLMDLNRAFVSRSGLRSSRGSARSLASGTVVDVMDMDVVTAPVGTSLGDAIAIMGRTATDRILIVDGDESVGIVTASDIARGLASRVVPSEVLGE